MAVTFDALGAHGSAGAGGLNITTNVTWAHTNAGNCLVVGVAVGKVGSGSTTTPVTYNGVALTSVARVLSGASGNGHLQMFYLLNPPVGTFNVVVTPSAFADIEAGSLSFSGVGSLGTPATASGNGTSGSAAVTTSASSMVVDLLAQGSGAAQTSAKTQRWMKAQSGGTAAGDGGQATAAGTGGTVTMSWTWAGSDSYGIIAVELQPSGGTAKSLADAGHGADALSATTSGSTAKSLTDTGGGADALTHTTTGSDSWVGGTSWVGTNPWPGPDGAGPSPVPVADAGHGADGMSVAAAGGAADAGTATDVVSVAVAVSLADGTQAPA